MFEISSTPGARSKVVQKFILLSGLKAPPGDLVYKLTEFQINEVQPRSF